MNELIQRLEQNKAAIELHLQTLFEGGKTLYDLENDPQQKNKIREQLTGLQQLYSFLQASYLQLIHLTTASNDQELEHVNKVIENRLRRISQTLQTNFPDITGNIPVLDENGQPEVNHNNQPVTRNLDHIKEQIKEALLTEGANNLNLKDNLITYHQRKKANPTEDVFDPQIFIKSQSEALLATIQDSTTPIEARQRALEHHQLLMDISRNYAAAKAVYRNSRKEKDEYSLLGEDYFKKIEESIKKLRDKGYPIGTLTTLNDRLQGAKEYLPYTSRRDIENEFNRTISLLPTPTSAAIKTSIETTKAVFDAQPVYGQ